MDKVLADAGLLVFTDTPDGKRIDWRRTKAVSQRSIYVYVNLKGRDPQGIVEPEDFDKVRDEVINALYDYTDPETGKKPIALALKKADARIIGLHGERIGDVVFGTKPEVGSEHGRQLTTGEYGVTSMKGLLIMAGPNIKQGELMTRTLA